jgi:hypothetical protein
MGLRERLVGEWQWILSMEVHGEGGVLVSLLECMGWVYERILGKVGGNFVVIPNLSWEMALRLDFSMISGVGIGP